MNPSRPHAAPQKRRELDHVSRAARRPLPIVGSAARLVGLPPDRPRTFFDVHPGLAPIFGCGALLNFGLTLRHEPGSQALRQCPEAVPCWVTLHPHRMEQAHGTNTETDS
jgi:hypothetical protein